MADRETLMSVDKGERIIADFEPATDRDRGVVSLEAQDGDSYAAVDVTETSAGVDLGTLRERDSADGFEIERFGSTRNATTVGVVEDFTTTDRQDLDPVGIGRDRRSGEFTPDNTVPAPRSPSDRDPDDGEFVTPDPRPITDIGRQRSDGLFDLF